MTGHHPWDELMRKHYTPKERERMLEEARRELEEDQRREQAPDGRKVAAGALGTEGPRRRPRLTPQNQVADP